MAARHLSIAETIMEEPSEHDTSGVSERRDSDEVGPLDADPRRSISSASLVSSGGHSQGASPDIMNLWAPSPSIRSRMASVDIDPLSPSPVPEPRTSPTWGSDGRSRFGPDTRDRNGSDEIDPRTPSTRHGSVAFALPTSREGSAANMDTDRRSTSATQNSTLSARSTPRGSISVQNVVIPAYLVRHVETSWNQDKIVNRRMSAVPRTDTRSKFNVEAMARDQQNHVRAASIAVGAIGHSSALDSTKSPLKNRKISFAPPTSQNPIQEDPITVPEPALERPFGNFQDYSFTPGQSEPRTDSTGARKASRMGSIWGSAPGERRGTIFQRSASVWQDVRQKVRRSSMWDVYDKAKVRQVELQRSKFVQILFQYSIYTICLAFIYFVLVGEPLWKGAVYWLYYVFKHKFTVPGTWAVVIGIAFLYAYTPLLVLFEPDPPMPEDLEKIDPNKTPGVQDTALMIPCYKAATLIGPTLAAATKIFPPSHIFVIANGNSPTPLDNTEEVCDKYGVNHIWSPVGSKIVAQFVGSYAAKGFKNVLLIDDDCALPPNFPIVSERMTGKVKCMGYTIKSVGPNSSRGTLCQQAQDLEYKISGIQRALAGKIGSATFPHGAISLWDRDFLIKTFSSHPGFSVSEDWFFGHVARQLGCRTKMCTSVFIETETPDAIFMSSGGERGGFGEMTVFKQRFYRWNFFFVNGMYYNMHYIITSWNLGWWELGAKLFVFQEVYETLLYLMTPFVLPISLACRYQFSLELLAGTFLMYAVNVLIFNEIHLRRKNERVGWKCLAYYQGYKFVLTMVNVASCYYAIFKYATYFAKRHAKIIEDDKAINVVLQLEEAERDHRASMASGGRRMTVTAIGSQTDIDTGSSEPGARKMTVTTLGPRLGSVDTIEEEALDEKMTLTATNENASNGYRRKPSITVGGRKISIVASSGDLPAQPSWMSSVPAQGNRGGARRGSDSVISKASVMSKARRGSDTVQSRVVTHGRRKSASRPIGVERIAEENEEEEKEEGKEEEVEGPEAEALSRRLQAIERELSARKVSVVDFAIPEARGLGILTEDEEGEASSSTDTDDSRKTSDSKSIV